MKRIVAREFLLLVSCIVLVLLLALFGWLRNAWFEHQIEITGIKYGQQLNVLDSLSAQAKPVQLDFLDLFDSAYVRKRPQVFLSIPSEAMDELIALVLAAPAVYKNNSHEQGQSDPLGIPPQTPLEWNERYLICIANALNDQTYLSVDQSELKPWEKYALLQRSNPFLRAALLMQFEDDSQSLNLALQQKGIPSRAEVESVHQAETSNPSKTRSTTLIAGVLLHDTLPYQELRIACEFLIRKNVVHCTFQDLFYTLHRKPVPPTQEALGLVTKQKVVVDKLAREQEASQLSRWSGAKQWAVVKWAAIVLLVLAYPLRLFVLGTCWALKTLKS